VASAVGRGFVDGGEVPAGPGCGTGVSDIEVDSEKGGCWGCGGGGSGGEGGDGEEGGGGV